MTKPENRWQFLLVADDGRIIPFRRIKGIVLVVMILLVILGVVCAGLAWQLTAERFRHQRTMEQLTDANRQMAHYKNEYELIAAELVFAEARMEKSGLLIPRQQERVPQQVPVKTIDTDPVPEVSEDDGEKESEPAAPDDLTAGLAATERPSDETAVAPMADPVKETTSERQPVVVSPEPEKPAVALGDLKMKHDTGREILVARFRVKNTGPRSSPVEGKCVVVLKNDVADPKAWLALPRVSLMDGKPDGKRGQPFKISRFRDMEIKDSGQTDLSSYKNATVYVFDTSGTLILAKDYPVDFPVPKPKPELVSSPATKATAVPVTTQAPAVPMESPAANMPMATPPHPGSGASLHPVPNDVQVDDPSLTDRVDPAKEEDVRSRF